MCTALRASVQQRCGCWNSKWNWRKIYILCQSIIIGLSEILVILYHRIKNIEMHTFKVRFVCWTHNVMLRRRWIYCFLWLVHAGTSQGIKNLTHQANGCMCTLLTVIAPHKGIQSKISNSVLFYSIQDIFEIEMKIIWSLFGGLAD